jgi:putative endonuclease
MSKSFLYILECADGSYYTGSTKDLERRLREHQNMLGANYTKRRLPVKLVYYEEYLRIDEAFYREKQLQGWSRKKKEALINGNPELLPKLAKKIFRNTTVASIKSPSSITQPPSGRLSSFSVKPKSTETTDT